MATCLEVIQSAYRRGGVTAAGVALNSRQTATGLEQLQELFDTMIGSGLLGQLTDYRLDAETYTAKENQRIFSADVDGATITLPDEITDECTGVVRTPRDGSLVVIADLYSITRYAYVYDAHWGRWESLAGLATNSECPLVSRYKNAVVSMLGVALCDENSLPAPPLLQKRAAMGRLSIASRYDVDRPRPQSEYY